MRLQIVSDVHLEFRSGHKLPSIKQCAPHIALLGDIGRPFSRPYGEFIRHLAGRWQTVLVLAGNHEMYGGRQRWTVDEVRERIQSICNRFPNVHYLENSSFDLGGIRILGCTLWTRIPKEMERLAKKKINDYRVSYVFRLAGTKLASPLTPGETNRWHSRSVRWLEMQLALDSFTPTIVLTHHAPTARETSDPKYKNQPLNCCYATNLEHLFRPPIRAWAYGHTHWPKSQTIKGVIVLSNPMGYPGELDQYKNKVIEI